MNPLPFFRTPRLLLAAALIAATRLGALAADDAIPAAVPADRYQSISARSPFTLSSAGDADQKGTWALIGLADNGANPLIFLVNRTSKDRMSVTRTPNEQGFSVDSVTYDPNLLQSSVRIKTPTETLVLRFDPLLIAVSNPAPPAPGAKPVVSGTPGVPAEAGVPGQPSGSRVRPGSPRLTPISRTVVPNPAAAAATAVHSQS